MFENFLQAIKNFFSSLFGKKETPPPPPPPPPVVDEEEDIPQDGSEIRPDTLVMTFNENDPIIFNDDTPDADFDDDIFDEDTEPEVVPTFPPEPEPDPIPEPPVTDPEPPVTEPDPPVPEPDPVPEPPVHQQRFLWCLDNGHGILTAGKRSPVFDDGVTQLLEYEFNRDVVKRIMAALDEKGVAYFDVVPDVDTVGNILEERVNRANRKSSSLPKIYLSVHANAAPAPHGSWCSPSISGVESWFYHGSRKGTKLAKTFQKEIIKATDWVSRGIKSRPRNQFYVLRKTRMPAVLTENGFYNNKAQAHELIKPEVRQKIADAHVAAIMKFEADGF